MVDSKKDVERFLESIRDQINEFLSSNNKTKLGINPRGAVRNFTQNKIKSSLSNKKPKAAKNPKIMKNKKATCKYCKGDDFYWGQTEWGWRLFDENNEQHMCKNKVSNGQYTSR